MADFWWVSAFSWCVICTFCGLIGNGLTVAIFAKFPKFRNSIGIFILSLTISDGLMCVLAVPLYGVLFFSMGRWKLGIELCKATKIISYGCFYTSAITTGLIAINRCVRIVCSANTYKKCFSSKIVALLLLINWSIPFIMLILISFDIGGTILVDEEREICGVKVNETFYAFIGIIAAVLLSTFICYPIIYCTVKRSQKRFLQDKSGGIRLLKMLLVTTVIFVICFLPAPLITFIYDKSDDNLQSSMLTFFYYIPYFVSLFLNPIIYGVLNTKFRSAYGKILKQMFCVRKINTSSRHGISLSSRNFTSTL